MNASSVQINQAPLQSDSPLFDEGFRAYENQFLDAEIRAMLESAPESMREKANGGIVDTVLTGAYRIRASRLLRDNLLTSQGCMPNSPVFKTNEYNASSVFQNA